MLYGPPAVGKLSVAQALAARTGFRVLHNHLLIDLGCALFDRSTPQSRILVHRLREVCLEVARAENLPGIILTYVYARDRDAYILGLCNQAEAQGDVVHLVQLSCKQETLEARVTESSREAFDKLTTVSGLRAKLGLLNEPFGQVKWRESLCVETDELTPDAVAEAIQADFKL